MNDDLNRPSDDRPIPMPPPANQSETHGELATADLAQVKPEPDQPPADKGDARPMPQEKDGAAPLFAADEAGKLRASWDDVQAGFVDEPRKAVEEADSLVASAMSRLAEIFAAERSRLEGAWDRGDEVSTEDLRVALQRYRSFFGRLLSV
ncbi:MAG TPA: hypothetical protein VGH15_06235 [Caulobacteraceae bacterium]|jgi:hypothetical protein